MLIIDTPEALSRPLPNYARHILDLRRDLIDLATFVIVGAGDTRQAVEDAAGFPIDHDDPPWEWVLDHGGTFEAPIITSDDGSGVVLIVPDDDTIDPTLRAILRDHAEPAEGISSLPDPRS